MEKLFICSWVNPFYENNAQEGGLDLFTEEMGYEPDEIKKVEKLKVWHGCQIGECHYILRIQ